MIFGHVRDGLVVPDRLGELPEGAAVRIELISSLQTASAHETNCRQGGQWRGQVVISPGFDELPDDLAEALGIRTP